MGVKVKLVVFVTLALSVYGQDVVSDERTVSDNVDKEISDNITDSIQNAKVEDPVEIITGSDIEIKSGKYQFANDGLTGDEPVDLEAVDLSPGESQNERQVLGPATTTSITNTEYGKKLKHLLKFLCKNKPKNVVVSYILSDNYLHSNTNTIFSKFVKEDRFKVKNYQ